MNGKRVSFTLCLMHLSMNVSSCHVSLCPMLVRQGIYVMLLLRFIYGKIEETWNRFVIDSRSFFWSIVVLSGTKCYLVVLSVCI